MHLYKKILFIKSNLTAGKDETKLAFAMTHHASIFFQWLVISIQGWNEALQRDIAKFRYGKIVLLAVKLTKQSS